MDTEQRKFFQVEHQEFLKNDALKGPWVTIFRMDPARDGLSLFSALIQKGNRERILQQAGWDMLYGDGGPSMSTRSGPAGPVHEYQKNLSDWIESLVLYCDFPSRDNYVELSEEFRLHHKLYHDTKRNRFVKFHDDGQEEDVAEIDGLIVRVKLSVLAEYLAVRQMDFVLFFEGRYWSTKTLAELGASTANDFSEQTDRLRMDFHTTKAVLVDDVKSISRLIGKMILPCPTDRVPSLFDRKDEDYPEFIIGNDEHGKSVKHSCDPDQLANYFGKNAGKPHYLTLVHFRREVLQKYYDNPQDSSVEDGVIKRGGFWQLRVDNDHSDYVIVHLGDLGKYLPEIERHHWLTYNIAPEGTMSKTAFMRNIRGFFADPVSADHVFKRTYEQLNQEWQAKHGWPFFLPLHSEDEHVFKTIRISLSENPAEFDTFSLGMTKLLIDSLNEAEMSKSISLEANDRGITKLQKYLTARGGSDPAPAIKFLRNLQDLRVGSAHRKSDRYEKAGAAFNLAEGFKIAGLNILNHAIAFLDHVRS